jgi:tetratricopeptide (TPR) repeat protein
LCSNVAAARPTGRAARRVVALGALIVAVAAGCGAGVNDDLLATATPYPVRSPVVPSPAASAATRGDGADFVATGEVALATGDWIAAEQAFDRALLREPGHVGALAGRAEARLAGGDVAGATYDLEALLDLEIDAAVGLRSRAALRLRFGDAAGAEADFDAAVAKDPADAAALAGRGLAVLATATGDQRIYDRALADFSRALAIDQDLALARLGPALVFADRAEFGGNPVDWEQAADEIATLGRTVPEHDARRAALAARVWLALGQPEEARRSLEPALTVGPVGPDLALLRAADAALLLAAGNQDDAVQVAWSAIAIDPLCWEARRTAISAELGRQAYDVALAEANQALMLLPGDGRLLHLKGLALAGLGQKAEAQEVLGAAGSALSASPVYQAKVALAIGSLESVPGLVETPAIRRHDSNGEMGMSRLERTSARRRGKGAG